MRELRERLEQALDRNSLRLMPTIRKQAMDDIMPLIESALATARREALEEAARKLAGLHVMHQCEQGAFHRGIDAAHAEIDRLRFTPLPPAPASVPEQMHGFRPNTHTPISCAVCGEEQRFHSASVPEQEQP